MIFIVTLNNNSDNNANNSDIRDDNKESVYKKDKRKYAK